jgi:hypothetical protein
MSGFKVDLKVAVQWTQVRIWSIRRLNGTKSSYFDVVNELSPYLSAPRIGGSPLVDQRADL